MRTAIAAAAVAGTLLTGIGAGATLLGPINAVADSSPTESAGAERSGAAHPRASWLSDALDKLVADGTINRSQADAVQAALRDARPGPGGPGAHARPGGPGMGLAAAAEAIGIAEQDLARALRDGKTVADVARDHGVEVTKVVDALVAEARERLDKAVENGRLTRERADQLSEDLPERVTGRVNGSGRPEGDANGRGRAPRHP